RTGTAATPPATVFLRRERHPGGGRKIWAVTPQNPDARGREIKKTGKNRNIHNSNTHQNTHKIIPDIRKHVISR
ncbi:hypothetical protein ACQWB2_24995, partial [Salmonella enterica subsp. enterica serovar Infantis]